MYKNYKDRVDQEINKIKNGTVDQNRFLGTAIDIQNRAYDGMYADKRMAFACDVLVRTGFCNPTECAMCKLTAANERAHKEIREHKRHYISIMREADLTKPIVLTYFDELGRVYSYRVSTTAFLTMQKAESDQLNARKINSDYNEWE